MNTSRQCAACNWLSELILRIDALEQQYVTLNQEFATKINQGVRDDDTVTFAGIITAGLVDGVDISAFKSAYDAKVILDNAFKSDYDSRMAAAESDIDELEGIVAGDMVIGKLNVNADKDWNGYAISNPGLIDGVDVSAFKADYDAKIDQGVKSTSTPTFAAIVVTGSVDGVDLSAFKSDYDSRMTAAEQDISDLEGIVAGDLVIGKLNVNANKDWNGYAITNIGNVDGVDISAFKSAYDTNINQAVKTTSSPTFAAITVTGNVDGVDISAFKSDYDAKVNQDVRSTASPTFAAITVTGNVDGVDISAFKSDYDAKVNQDVRSTATPTHQNIIVGAIAASDNLKISNDTERLKTASATYALAKEILVNAFFAGTIRVKWDMKSNNSGGTIYGMVYINGVAVGAEKSVTGINYATQTQDLTVALVPGDKIQIYYKIATYSAYLRNHRLYWDETAKSALAEGVWNY